MKIAFFLFLFTTGMASAFAQTTPDEMVAKFFTDFKIDKGNAVKNIYQTNTWMSKASDAISNMVGEVEKLTPDYVGEYYGYSLICKKQLSDCFVLQSYIVRYDRQPLRFTFEFYKPDEEWQLYSSSFDVNLDDELEEAAKVYYLTLDR
ncbi:MAG: hypothetical protein HY842_15200 [Bacteroidetes bacterium]|nr:hypothetical protein [Bacteroidota bacterium]